MELTSAGVLGRSGTELEESPDVLKDELFFSKHGCSQISPDRCNVQNAPVAAGLFGGSWEVLNVGLEKTLHKVRGSLLITLLLTTLFEDPPDRVNQELLPG